MKTILIIATWVAIIASFNACNRTMCEQAAAHTQANIAARDSMLNADFDIASIPMVYKEAKHIQHEVAGKLANAGYPTHKFHSNFKVGLTRALQQYQYEHGLLMADLSNSGKLCPLTARSLDIAIY